MFVDTDHTGQLQVKRYCIVMYACSMQCLLLCLDRNTIDIKKGEESRSKID